MKRLFQVSACMVFVMISAGVQAQEKAPLGNGNLALKLDYIQFTDDYFDTSGRENDGIYVGLEGYGKVTPNLYLGGEIGQATNIDLFGGEDIDFVPIELNLKYASEPARNLVVDFGAGLSYSYVELRSTSLFSSTANERDDWLFGGQIFADLTYKLNWFLAGVNAKYQMTEDFEDSDVDLSNWRLGFHLGVVF
jgi:hypothetical protein